MGQKLIYQEFTEAQLKQISTLYGWGHSVRQIADFLGVGRSTFYEYLERFPALKTAMRQGRAEANAAVDNSLFKAATNGDVQAIRWWDMSRRGKGNGTQPVDNDLDDEQTFDPSSLSDEKLQQLESLMNEAHGVIIEGEVEEVVENEGYENVTTRYPEAK